MRHEARTGSTADHLIPFATRQRALPERLRDETRDLHDEIEANSRFMRLMAPDLTRDEYRSLIGRLYGHHSPAEAAIARVAHLLPPALDLPRRLCREALLSRDLQALGLVPDEIAKLPLCAVGSFTSAEEGWGWMYVLEGSALGGQIISRHLSAVLELGPSTGAGAVSPHGSDTGTLWRQFKHLLTEASARDDLDEDAVVAAARAAFASLHGWVAGCT